MTSDGDNYSSFPENQLIKISCIVVLFSEVWSSTCRPK